MNVEGRVLVGVWLSLFSSLVLAVCFTIECKHAFGCSWLGLVPALMGFARKNG
ncbi:MAG: hypothetical protein AB1696_27240 [Planctomycetota bacterium]